MPERKSKLLPQGSKRFFILNLSNHKEIKRFRTLQSYSDSVFTLQNPSNASKPQIFHSNPFSIGSFLHSAAVKPLQSWKQQSVNININTNNYVVVCLLCNTDCIMLLKDCNILKKASNQGQECLCMLNERCYIKVFMRSFFYHFLMRGLCDVAIFE